MAGRSSQRARYSPAPAACTRTCVGCRTRAAKSDLLRLVAAGDVIVPDPRARLHGRGAYLHPSQRCFELAQRRRAFPRALRAEGPLGTGPLAEYLGIVSSRADTGGRNRQTGSKGGNLSGSGSRL